VFKISKNAHTRRSVISDSAWNTGILGKKKKIGIAFFNLIFFSSINLPKRRLAVSTVWKSPVHLLILKKTSSAALIFGRGMKWIDNHVVQFSCVFFSGFRGFFLLSSLTFLLVIFVNSIIIIKLGNVSHVSVPVCVRVRASTKIFFFNCSF